jgi:hypothetical protein
MASGSTINCKRCHQHLFEPDVALLFARMGPSLSGTAVAIIVAGFLNVSRARDSDELTRAFSAIGNILVMVLAVGIEWPVRYHLLHN